MSTQASTGSWQSGPPRECGQRLAERIRHQDAERAVLGSLMSREVTSLFDRARARLIPDDFDLVPHRCVYAAIGRIVDRGASPDLVVTAAELDSAGELELAGGRLALTEMLRSNSPWAFDSHLDLIRDASQRRGLAAAARELGDSAHDPRRTMSELLASMREHADKLGAKQSGSDRMVRAAMNARDFLALELQRKPSLLGEGVIGAGTYTLLYGKPGTGKTSLAVQLAVAVASGAPWFGLSTVPGGARVGVLELELPAEMLQDRLSRAVGDDARVRERISVIVRPFLKGVLDLSTPHDLSGLRAWIEREGLALIILDALGRSHSLDQNAIGPLLNALDPLLRETGCAMLMIHHDRKAGNDPQREGDDLDAARGDSRLTGDAATTARIVRRGNLRCLRFGKTWAGAEPEPLWFVFGEDGLPVQVDAPTEKTDKDRERILDALRELGVPATVSEVRARLGDGAPSSDTLTRRLRELEKDRRVVPAGQRKTNRTRAKLWGVADADAAHATHAPQMEAAQRGTDCETGD